VYAINPTTSRPSEQFAAMNPDFWKPKAMAAAPGKALATKKTEPKP
jgi:hypothetical protein